MNNIIVSTRAGEYGSVGCIQLNAAASLNALNLQMVKQLQVQLSIWEDDEAIQAVLIYSDNPDVFCAGGDLRELYEARDLSLADQASFFQHEYSLNDQIHHYSKPYIALVDGIAMGGGLGISVHGSHVVVAENLRMAMPECGIGFFPDAGMGYVLSRMPHASGLYMGLSGASIGPSSAFNWGLATHTIAMQSFPTIIDGLMQIHWSDYPHRDVDEYLNQFCSPLSNQYDIIWDDDRTHAFAENTVEAVLLQLANLGEWGKHIIQQIESRCPLSLRVFMSQYHRFKSLYFRDCIQQEFHLAQHFLQGYTFFEGIRATIVAKDHKPKWQPAFLGEVSEETVDAYFEEMQALEIGV